MKTLVTGGGGFIGTHLVRRLLREGCTVTILDNFSSQVHSDGYALPDDVARCVRLVKGDVRDSDAWSQALQGQDSVIHLAAETGTGQSMYEVSKYADVNIGGTAHLLQHIVDDPRNTVERLVVASSRAVYGEGSYLCLSHGLIHPAGRRVEDLARGIYDPRCSVCGAVCSSVPTREDAPLRPCSFYGLTKQVQEEMMLMLHKTSGISCYALRYQNVYGPGQSLNNPYTGILAIFSTLARLNAAIHIFEDGLESRDFVFIDDVVEGTWRALSAPCRGAEVLNVGSGTAVTVLEVAESVRRFFRSESTITITGEFRAGDIRHNTANTVKAEYQLGFVAARSFEEGLKEFLEWADSEPVSPSGYEESLAEMKERGLLHA